MLQEARDTPASTESSSQPIDSVADLSARIRATQARFASQAPAKQPAVQTAPAAPTTEMIQKPAGVKQAPEPPLKAQPLSGYTIQLGSFRKAENRIKLSQRFPEDAPLYRFRIADLFALSYGLYPSPAAASNQAAQLREQGFQDLYIRPVPEALKAQ